MLKIETYITPKAHTHRHQPQPNDFCEKIAIFNNNVMK